MSYSTVAYQCRCTLSTKTWTFLSTENARGAEIHALSPPEQCPGPSWKSLPKCRLVITAIMAIKASGSGRELNAVLSGKLDPGAAIVPGTRRTLDELLTALRKVRRAQTSTVSTAWSTGRPGLKAADSSVAFRLEPKHQQSQDLTRWHPLRYPARVLGLLRLSGPSVALFRQGQEDIRTTSTGQAGQQVACCCQSSVWLRCCPAAA